MFKFADASKDSGEWNKTMQPLFFCQPKKLGRWAVGPLGRWAVGPLMAVAVFAPHAQAQTVGGSWQVDTDTTTKFKYHTAVDTNGNDNPQDDGFTPVEMKDIDHNSSESEDHYGIIGGHTIYGAASSGFGGLATSIKGQVEFSVKLRWVPDAASPSAAPPTKGALRLTNHADIWGDAAGDITLDVNNALDTAPEVAPGTPRTYRDSRGNSLTEERLNSHGIKLIPFDNSSGASELTLGPFTATFDGNATSPGSIEVIPGRGTMSSGSPSYLRFYFHSEAELDDRSVKLSRSGATGEETTYENGVSVTHGDTTYSYYQANPPHQMVGDPTTLRKNWQGIGALLSGPWQSYSYVDGVESYGTFSWSPAGTSGFYVDTSTGSLQLMPTGKLTMTADGKWERTNGAGSPTDLSIAYKITDADGATADATYKLTVHEPFEIQNEDSYPIFAYFPLWGSGATPSDPNGVMQPNGPFSHNGQNNPSVGTATGTSQGLSIGVSGEFGPEDVGAALGISAEWSSETSNSVERNWPLNIDVGANEFAFPVVQDKYIRHKIDYRHFEANGEHKLSIESPPGSGLYDTPFHQIVKDEFSGRNVVWNKLPLRTGRVPSYTPDAVTPDNTDPSGGSA